MPSWQLQSTLLRQTGNSEDLVELCAPVRASQSTGTDFDALAHVTLQELLMAPMMLIGVLVGAWLAFVVGFTGWLFLDLPIALLGGGYVGGAAGFVIHLALAYWVKDGEKDLRAGAHRDK